MRTVGGCAAKDEEAPVARRREAEQEPRRRDRAGGGGVGHGPDERGEVEHVQRSVGGRVCGHT